MKKKIIFFLHDFYVGGAEKNIVNYANYLINQNIDVYIITLSNKGILKRYVNKKVKIAVTGLNPHCESIDRFKEDKKIILPAVNYLKKENFSIYGPYPADTIFLNNNRKKFDIIIGMYHDQVLAPIKTLFEYDAINITLGLPFIRVSPDHGPNEKMMGKNNSNFLSMLNSIRFLDH